MINSNQDNLRIVDSSTPVSQKLISDAQGYLNQKPVAWGRYFTTNPSVEYSHSSENNFLNEHNIKLLPIARHTNHVGGSYAQGQKDAIDGVNDLFATFSIDYWKSQGSEFLYFLDVEGNSTGPNGSISEDYYNAWSETLISHSKERSGNSVTILPCVYANYHDETTFSILKQEGIRCEGLWMARYHSQPEKMTPWEENFAVPEAIQNSNLPVFLWQYAGGNQINQDFDLDLINPNINDIQSTFLDKLILPPKI
ncbi:MAG: hypothetical protein AB8H03_11090 [Saprospiraceae bacterium]